MAIEHSILKDGSLDLSGLRKLTARPRLYSGRDASFWTDPYVSRHVLLAHLDPDDDAATRRPELVDRTVATIRAHLDRTASAAGPRRILDLVCGPGLYAERFAARGDQVTGIDFSPSSIAYARDRAARLGLEIDYRCENVLSARYGSGYDLATLIYGEFGTISETERRRLLRKVHAALAPGGLLVFDVFTRSYVERESAKPDWYVSLKDGFWQDGPHLVLERHHHYPKDKASAACYAIVDESGSMRRFTIWSRYFTRSEIVGLLAEEGFAVEAAYGSLWGDPWDEGGEWIGLYARRLG